jgi:PilZ domain
MEESAAAREKRTGKRLPMQLLVSVRSSAGSEFFEVGETRDVSAGGVYFYSTAALQVGMKVDLLLPLPDQLADAREVWVLCNAEVARSEPMSDGRTGIGALIDSYEIVPQA